jgi:uncharacterized protein (TIGR02453 family)
MGVIMSNFNGFSKQTLQFFRDLKENNDRIWFQQNKNRYEDYVLKESQDFVVDMGAKLESLAPDITAIPKIDKSIFRIYRDTRFSKNKLPYKTHLALLLWDGDRKKLENPGFYFHLEPEKLFLGVGMHEFPKPILQSYRDAVIDGRLGSALNKAISKVNNAGNYVFGWKKYKKTPHGFDADHERADLLLYGGIGFQYEEALPKVLHKPELIDYCFNRYKDMAPIHEWLKLFLEKIEK